MKISDHCFAIKGLYFFPPWSVNAGIICTENNTLIIDTGSNYDSGQIIYDYAVLLGEKNNIQVINTEKHFDHIGGNCFFKSKSINIYGHKSINKKKIQYEGLLEYFNNLIIDKDRKKCNEENLLFKKTEVVNPDKLFSEDFIIKYNNLTIHIICTPGHTESNISVYIPEDKVLFSGDCIVNQYLPNLNEGNVSDWKIWLNSLEIIKNLDVEAIVPGHGDIIYGKKNIQDEIKRIENILLKNINNNDMNLFSDI